MGVGLEDTKVLALTGRDEFDAALIPWRAAQCPTGPAAAQISWLNDMRRKSFT